MVISLPLRWFYLVTRPLTWLMYISAAGILKVFRIEPASERDLAHSEEELRMIIEASQEVGHIDEVEQTLMRRALTFGDRRVSDIMVPRTEMAALQTSTTVAEAIPELALTSHTRYPVYEEDVDPGILERCSCEVVILGHTHVPFSIRLPSGVVANPGSVGQPRDGDPKASLAVLDTGSLKCEVHRVEYDIDEEAEAIRSVGLPEILAKRLYIGR